MSKKSERITADKKELLQLLLQPGHYLRYRMGNGGSSVAMVYQGKQVPVKYFSRNVLGLIEGLLRTDKKGRLIISRRLIRSMDGRSTVKKVYKSVKNGTSTKRTNLSANPTS